MTLVFSVIIAEPLLRTRACAKSHLAKTDWETRRHRCSSLSGGEFGKHGEEGGEGGGERGGTKGNTRGTAVGTQAGRWPTWASWPPLLGWGWRETGRGGREEGARATQLGVKARGQRQGTSSSAPVTQAIIRRQRLLRAPRWRDEVHTGEATCPGHTTLSGRAGAHSCPHRPGSRDLVRNHIYSFTRVL